MENKTPSPSVYTIRSSKYHIGKTKMQKITVSPNGAITVKEFSHNAVLIYQFPDTDSYKNDKFKKVSAYPNKKAKF
jgi:hypothetical protein